MHSCIEDVDQAMRNYTMIRSGQKYMQNVLEDDVVKPARSVPLMINYMGTSQTLANIHNKWFFIQEKSHSFKM